MHKQHLDHPKPTDTFASGKLGTIMKKSILCVALTAALSGCVSAEQIATAYNSQTPPKATTRAAVIEYAKKTYFDPYSMRDVALSHEIRGTVPNAFGVCLRANAKNRMGAYTGLTATSFQFNNGIITKSYQNDFACNDPRVKYEPFRELEGS